MNRLKSWCRPKVSVARPPLLFCLALAFAGCTSERTPANIKHEPTHDASVEPSPPTDALDASTLPTPDANAGDATLTSELDASTVVTITPDAHTSTAVWSSTLSSTSIDAAAAVETDASAQATTTFDSTTIPSSDSQPLDSSTGVNTSSTITTSSESDSSNDGDCNLDASVTLSPVIGTVGIVTLTTSLDTITEGYIDFGPDLAYGMRAKLDVSSQNFRTLLLGLTPATTYQYRVVVRSNAQTCATSNQSFVTTPPPAAVPLPQVTTHLADEVSPGFVVTSGFPTTGSSDSYLMIYNHRGELVWWYPSLIGPITRARIAWDGKFIYGRDANPAGNSGGKVFRVSMDGLRAEQLDIDTGHHDMTVMPNNGFLFLTGAGRDDCSTVTYLSPSGQLTLFYDLRDAFGSSFKPAADPCHCNSIDYNSADRSVSVSCLNQNAYIKLSEAGELLWVLGGNNGQSEFTGDVHWNRQHGHHFVSPTRLVFYNNNGGGDSSATTSVAVELELDLVKRTATRVWQYVGGETSGTLGDVQRLPNGNTLVTYSNSATIREVQPDLDEVQTWVFDNGIGYSEHRTSLYGAAPRN